jgi:hypothetical protein
MTKRTPAEIAKQWEDMGKVPRRPKTLLEVFSEEDDMPKVGKKNYPYTKKGKADAAAAKKGSKKK